MADTLPQPLQLKGLTLNIGAAALKRAQVILEWLRRREDDLIVLTETSAGIGTEFLSVGLTNLGYRVVATPPSNDRGVMVATRLGVRTRFCASLDVTLPWRAAGVILETNPAVAVVGVYVPSRDRSPTKIAKKRAFISSFLRGLEALPAAVRRNLLIAGDYNVVSRRHEPRRQGYFPYEYEMHEALERLGFTAGHEVRGDRTQPHSWIGRTGDGYLYDYVHLGQSLQPHLSACDYIHNTREQQLSDHAAVAFSLSA